jgi:hypothetical protein
MCPGGFFVISRWTPRQRGRLKSRFHSSRQLDVNLPDLYSEVSHRTPGIVAAPQSLAESPGRDGYYGHKSLLKSAN